MRLILLICFTYSTFLFGQQKDVHVEFLYDTGHKDSTTIYFANGTYTLSAKEKPKEKIPNTFWVESVTLNDDYTVYGFSGIGKVNDSTRESSNCEIIAKRDYRRILRKDRRRDVSHRNYRIEDVGLIAIYTFTPRRPKDKYLPMSFGVVEINMHTGGKIQDRVIHGRF